MLTQIYRISIKTNNVHVTLIPIYSYLNADIRAYQCVLQWKIIENVEFRGKHGKCGIRFSTINETYGHAEPGAVWRECVRSPRTTAPRAQRCLKGSFGSMGKYGKLWKIWENNLMLVSWVGGLMLHLGFACPAAH